MYVDLASDERSWIEIYRLCIGFVNPRPIALVSTRSASGVDNVAPYSFFNMVSGNPPVVMVCPSIKRDHTHKDTLNNIVATREFVIATVTADIAEQMVASAAPLPPDQSEFEFAQFTRAPAKHVQAPLVAEAHVNIECTLREIKSFGDHPGAGQVVFGDLRAIHLDDAALDEQGRIDPRKLSTVGRLGGQWYCNVTEPYAMRIPEPDEPYSAANREDSA